MSTTTEYKRIQTINGELILRRYQESDLADHVQYLFDSPQEFLESIGFDTIKLGARENWIKTVKTKLSDPANAQALPSVIVAEFQGRALSMVFLDQRNADKIPRFHFHIFEPAMRGLGLGGIIFQAGSEILSNLHGYDYFLIEPKASNTRMNALMRKLGFKHLKDYLLPAGPFTKEMLVSQYEIRIPNSK